MFYVLSDNLDEGLELNEFETTEAMLSFFRDKDLGAERQGRAQDVIVGTEVGWAEVKKAIDGG